MGFWALLGLSALVTVAARLLAPKNRTSQQPGTVEPPTIEPGRPIPVVYGRTLVEGAVVWFDGATPVSLTKRVRSGLFGLTSTKVPLGYTYKARLATLLGWNDGARVWLHDVRFEGAHWLSEQGTSRRISGNPFDGDFLVEDVAAVSGASLPVASTDADGLAVLDLYLPNLYGGKEEEGGVEGDVRVQIGNTRATAADSYLVSEAAPLVVDDDGDAVSPTPVPWWDDLAYVVHADTVLGKATTLKPWTYEVERQVGRRADSILVVAGENWDGAAAGWEHEWSVAENSFGDTPPDSAYINLSNVGGGGAQLIENSKTFGPADGIAPNTTYDVSVIMTGNGIGVATVVVKFTFSGSTTCELVRDSGSTKRYTGVVTSSATGEITVDFLASIEADAAFRDIYLDDLVIGFAGDATIGDILWDVLTNQRYGLGLSEALLDQGSFEDADAAMTAEGLGVSLAVTAQRPARDLIDELLAIADGVLDRSPVTGKLELRLVRAPEGSEPAYDPDTGLLGVSGARREWADTLNDCVVEFTNRARGYTADAVSAKDEANIAMTGSTRSETLSYPSVMRESVARRLAARALRAASLPLWKGQVRLDRRAYGLMRGDAFQITWPDLGFDGLWVRALAIDRGALDKGVIVVDVIEDAFQYAPALTPSPGDPTVTTAPPAGSAFRPPEVEPRASQTATTGTVELAIYDDGDVVTAVEFATLQGTGTASAWTADAGPDYEQSVTLVPGATSTIFWRVTYTLPDGTSDTIEGEQPFDHAYAIAPPVLGIEANGDGTYTVTATLPGGADRIYFAGSDSAPPSAATVQAATPDTSDPFTFTTPAIPADSTYYLAAAAGDGTTFSALARQLLHPTPATTAAAYGFDDQSANTVLAGPASGADAAPAFRALVTDDLPAIALDDLSDVDTTSAAPTDGQALVWDDDTETWVPGTVSGSGAANVYTASRTVPSSAGDFVDVGSFNTPQGTFLIGIAWGQPNSVVAKHYVVTTTYNDTGDAWQNVTPLRSARNGNADVQLEVKVSTTAVAFRIRRTAAGSVSTITAGVTVVYLGNSTAPTFSASTSTGTSSTTTAYTGSTMPITAITVPSFSALSSSSGAATWATGGAMLSNATLTLTENVTLSITGAVNGASGYLEVTQDSTGGRTLTLPSGTVLGATTSINGTASKKTGIAWAYNGSAFTFVLAREA